VGKKKKQAGETFAPTDMKSAPIGVERKHIGVARDLKGIEF
jgi:hypothetical protein